MCAYTEGSIRAVDAVCKCLVLAFGTPAVQKAALEIILNHEPEITRARWLPACKLEAEIQQSADGEEGWRGPQARRSRAESARVKSASENTQVYVGRCMGEVALPSKGTSVHAFLECTATRSNCGFNRVF
jgi:hypothetical protein